MRAIILSSIYESGSTVTGPGDIGYEVTNHTAIDADYGNMTDFDDLVAKDHEKGDVEIS